MRLSENCNVLHSISVQMIRSSDDNAMTSVKHVHVNVHECVHVCVGIQVSACTCTYECIRVRNKQLQKHLNIRLMVQMFKG